MTPTGDGFTNPYRAARARLDAAMRAPSAPRAPVPSVQARLNNNLFKGPSGVGVGKGRPSGSAPQAPKYSGPRLSPEAVARPSNNLPSRIQTPGGTTQAAGAAASVATATAAARGFGGKIASQVAGSLGGAAGVGVAVAPIVKGTIDNAFDRAFPDLAPYRKITDNFNPLVPGASSEYSPFNPFSPWYDWAPWNDRKSKNSLNPLPSIEDHNIPIQGQPTDIPFDYPPNQAPFDFKVISTGKIDHYNSNRGERFFVRSEDFNDTRQIYGVPEYLKIVPNSSWGCQVLLKLRGLSNLVVVFYNLGLGPDPANWLLARTELVSFSTDLQPINGPRTPWPFTSQPDFEPLPIPNREIFPQPAPQFEPEGRPEYPRFPQPDTAPQPQRSPAPSPSPQPSPAPAPMPNQPSPIPLPSIDPTAAPSADPKPRFDPAPAPGPNRSPSPAPNPANKPFPGKQKNPGDYHFEYYDENWRTPDIVKEKQQEKQRRDQQQYQPNPNPNPNANPNTAPTPEPNPNPLPAPDFDMCKDPCMADIHDNSKGQKPKKIEYKLFKKCGDNGPEFETKTLDVPANQADALKILLDDAADRKGEKCTLEANTLTIPEWWAVRPGADRPQFVVIYAEVFKTGKLGKSRWQLTIPHYNRPKGAKPKLPKYSKGNWMGTLTLTDNSKIRINARTASECKRVLNQLKILLPVDKRMVDGKGIKPTILERADSPLKECNVVPVRGDYYAGGQKNGQPDWSVNLR